MVEGDVGLVNKKNIISMLRVNPRTTNQGVGDSNSSGRTSKSNGYVDSDLTIFLFMSLMGTPMGTPEICFSTVYCPDIWRNGIIGTVEGNALIGAVFGNFGGLLVLPGLLAHL